MTDLFTLLEAKTKEVERLTASEQALNEESALAKKFMKNKVPLYDLMQKMHDIESALPLIKQIDQRQTTVEHDMIELRSKISDCVKKQECQTQVECLRQDMITFFKQQMKSFKQNFQKQLQQKACTSKVMEDLQCLVLKKDFSKHQWLLEDKLGDIDNVREVLLKGYKVEAQTALNGKLDVDEAIQLLNLKQDAEKGAGMEIQLRNVKSKVKEIENKLSQILEDEGDQSRESSSYNESVRTKYEARKEVHPQKTSQNLFKNLNSKVHLLKKEFCLQNADIDDLKGKISQLETRVDQESNKAAENATEAQQIKSHLADLLKKYQGLSDLMQKIQNQQTQTKPSAEDPLSDKVRGWQDAILGKLNVLVQESNKLGRRVQYLEKELQVVTQDVESHKMFKKRQIDQLARDLHDLRDYKVTIQRNIDALHVHMASNTKHLQGQLNQTNEQVNLIKDPLVKELGSMQSQGDCLMTELHRQQGQNRELISEFFKLMDSKIKGNEQEYFTQLNDRQEEFVKSTARAKLQASMAGNQISEQQVPSQYCQDQSFITRTSPITPMSQRPNVVKIPQISCSSVNRRRAGTSWTASREIEDHKKVTQPSITTAANDYAKLSFQTSPRGKDSQLNTREGLLSLRSTRNNSQLAGQKQNQKLHIHQLEDSSFPHQSFIQKGSSFNHHKEANHAQMWASSACPGQQPLKTAQKKAHRNILDKAVSKSRQRMQSHDLNSASFNCYNLTSFRQTPLSVIDVTKKSEIAQEEDDSAELDDDTTQSARVGNVIRLQKRAKSQQRNKDQYKQVNDQLLGQQSKVHQGKVGNGLFLRGGIVKDLKKFQHLFGKRKDGSSRRLL